MPYTTAPHGAGDLMVLDDKTQYWLNTITDPGSTTAWGCHHCCLEKHPLWVRHKQDGDLRFIFFLVQAAVLGRSDADSDGVKPALSFVI